MIKFLRGNVENLPQVATSGAVYFTQNEGLYLGLADGTYHRYGDFIEVADVASLPTTGAHVKAMYYCTAENILAKWNGVRWVQINKQQTLEELGGVAKSVYEAKVAALTKADSDNADAIADVETRLQAAEDKLDSVATTEGLDELNDAVAEHAAAIDTINGTVDTEGSMLNIAKNAADAKDAAIQEAKDAADQAQSDINTLAETHAADKEALEEAIELKANASDVYTNGEIDDKIAELVAEDERLEGLINGNAADIGELETEIDTMVGSDAGKSIRTIANEELAAQLIPESAAEALNTLQEIAAWIQEHPDSASAMNAAIEDLQAKMDTDDQTVSAYVSSVIESLGIDDYATAEELSGAIERIVTLETDSATHATQEALEAVADDLDTYKQAHNSDYDNDTIDEMVENVQEQIDALGNTYATDSELATAKTELQGKIDTVSGALDTYKNENNTAVALKANAADVYTKDEIVAMLTWGDFGA
jgi:hypothetical protein